MHLVRTYTRWIVGSGENLRFWDDALCSETLLGVQHYIPAELAHTRDYTVSRFKETQLMQQLHSLQYSHDFLSCAVSGMHLLHSEKDEPIWSLVVDGILTL